MVQTITKRCITADRAKKGSTNNMNKYSDIEQLLGNFAKDLLELEREVLRVEMTAELIRLELERLRGEKQ